VTGACLDQRPGQSCAGRLAPGGLPARSTASLRPRPWPDGRPASHARVMPDRLTPAHRSRSRCLVAWDDASMVHGSGAAVRLNSACGRNVAIGIAGQTDAIDATLRPGSSDWKRQS
jgi:hypothetical protein